MIEIKDIAEKLNNFFTNAGSNLAKKKYSEFFKPIHQFLKLNTQHNGKKLVANRRVTGDSLLIKSTGKSSI